MRENDGEQWFPVYGIACALCKAKRDAAMSSELCSEKFSRTSQSQRGRLSGTGALAAPHTLLLWNGGSRCFLASSKKVVVIGLYKGLVRRAMWPDKLMSREHNAFMALHGKKDTVKCTMNLVGFAKAP